jgi:hypothetical protein
MWRQKKVQGLVARTLVNSHSVSNKAQEIACFILKSLTTLIKFMVLSLSENVSDRDIDFYMSYT